MDLLVVGAGAMGRWFARVVDAEVALCDADPTVAEAAADAVGGRSVPVDTNESFDVVCLAVPMRVASGAVAEYAPRAREAVVDVAGVMAGPVAAMREHAPDRERISMHPLFAPENAPGRVAVVADAPGPVTDEVRASLRAAGNDLFETTVEEHDRAMETVQARAHTAVLAYALAAEDVPEAFHTPLSEPLRDLAEQVTGGTPRVYADIQATFDGAEAVAEAACRIADADDDDFEALYCEATERVRGNTDGNGTGNDDATDGNGTGNDDATDGNGTGNDDATGGPHDGDQ